MDTDSDPAGYQLELSDDPFEGEIDLGNTFGSQVGSNSGWEWDDQTYQLAYQEADEQRGTSFDANNPLGSLGTSQAQAESLDGTQWTGNLENQQTNQQPESQLGDVEWTDESNWILTSPPSSLPTTAPGKKPKTGESEPGQLPTENANRDEDASDMSEAERQESLNEQVRDVARQSAIQCHNDHDANTEFYLCDWQVSDKSNVAPDDIDLDEIDFEKIFPGESFDQTEFEPTSSDERFQEYAELFQKAYIADLYANYDKIIANAIREDLDDFSDLTTPSGRELRWR